MKHKFDMTNKIGALTIVVILSLFLMSVSTRVQNMGEKLRENKITIERMSDEIESLENEKLEMNENFKEERMELLEDNSILQDVINQINANNEAKIYLEESKE